MVWFGVDSEFVQRSLWHTFGYWTVFLLFILVTGYTVVLDVRYIRLQYALARRQVFLQTLGEEEFRKTLRAAQAKTRAAQNVPEEDPSGG